MKRIVTLFLTLCLCLPMIVACKQETPDPYLYVVENGTSQYNVIYPEGSDATRSSANRLAIALSDSTGLSFKPAIASRTPESPYEILVGNTGRKAASTA